MSASPEVRLRAMLPGLALLAGSDPPGAQAERHVRLAERDQAPPDAPHRDTGAPSGGAPEPGPAWDAQRQARRWRHHAWPAESPCRRTRRFLWMLRGPVEDALTIWRRFLLAPVWTLQGES